jgi:hypothetical protein
MSERNNGRRALFHAVEEQKMLILFGVGVILLACSLPALSPRLNGLDTGTFKPRFLLGGYVQAAHSCIRADHQVESTFKVYTIAKIDGKATTHLK